jgi:hypothetical protein
MTEGMIRLFYPDLPAGDREWTIGSEGLPMGWAFLVFLILGAGVIFAYRKFGPGLSPRWRWTLTGLRVIAVAIVLVLLVKPVLQVTINEAVRQNFLVLLDASQSMLLKDQRTSDEDRQRAAIALNRDAAPSEISRWDLLAGLSANEKLNLWPRLQEKADVMVYRFGRDASLVGALSEKPTVTAAEAAARIGAIQPDEPVSAIGHSLRQILEESRGRAVGGILLITDGANNSGLPPIEAARMAGEAGVPFFAYGVGVTSPVDLVMKAVETPRIGFVRERVEAKVQFRAQSLGRRSVTVVLKANGTEVGREMVVLEQDGNHAVTIPFVPEETGEIRIEASVAGLPGEVATDNNALETKLRVVDDKIKVLLIEQEPRWDFRYLLAYLQRDRRLSVKCFLIDAEADLDTSADSVFLPDLPVDREGLFDSEIMILGDVNPADLGSGRMRVISEWVEQANGGLIFLAGPRFNPAVYAATPLADLLPVMPDPLAKADPEARFQTPMPLVLTLAGERSPYLRLVDDPVENRKIWAGFPGVRWIAPVARAKPGTEVLLAAGGNAGREGTPVIAVHGFGGGETVFIGTDETYRWRSRTGEKFYSQVWGAIMQALALRRLEGASVRTQLQADRERYFVGDRVTLSGKIHKRGFEPHTVDRLEGRLREAGDSGSPGEPLGVNAVAGQPGVYRAEFVAERPGKYAYSTLDDPEALVRFEVIEPKVEQMETAMNERSLQAMANAARGHFLREEDLDNLPDLVAAHSATVASFRTLTLFHSTWWMLALFLVLFTEWLLRRLLHLK